MVPDLVSAITIPLTPFHEERVRMIDNEDFSGVIRKVRVDAAKHGEIINEDYLVEGIFALKQYYVVALLDPNRKHAVSDEIDPFWHAHILHTREYMAFCDRVYGQYVPHEPLDHDKIIDVDEVAELYAYTARLYQLMFGYINPVFYPLVMPRDRLMCTHSEITASAVASRALVK